MQEDNEQELKKQFYFNFPAVDLLNKNYSLQPDIITGWKPKARLMGPIPLNFDSLITDEVIDELTSFGTKHKERVIYLGHRYANSFKLHQQINRQYRFKHEGIINGSFSNMAAYFRKFHANFKSKNMAGRLFKGMNPTLKSSDELIFNSNFQSGNLDAVIKVGENEYDLFMRVDTNTRGHVQWFNFKIKNTGRSKVKLNVINFRKLKSLYNRGMKPYVFSEHLKQTKEIGWNQGGFNVKYEKQKLRYNFLSQNFHEEPITFNCLKFQYAFQTQSDTVQFAYCPPFTYSQMIEMVKTIKKPCENSQKFITEEVLCESLSGLDIPLLTITDPESVEKKKCILAWARIHPGETCGSHMMNGFLKYICSDNDEAKFIRKKIVFKVIPMLNVDGVVAGNFRTSLCGKDLNRQFKTNSTFLIPEVRAVKELALQLRSEFKSRFLFFLDFHGHSVKKNVFLYGPEYEIWQTNYYKTRIFPKLISEKTEIFRYYSCLFRIADFKRTTARAVLLNYVPHCYTIEASTGSYYSPQEKKDINFTSELWEFMGKCIGESTFNYMELVYDLDAKRQNKNQTQKVTDLKAFRKTCRRGSLRKNDLDNQRCLLSVTSAQKQIKRKKKELDVPGSLNERARQYVQEIKKQQNITNQSQKHQEGHESDNFSEGGSDSEGSEDDIPEQQLQKLHKQIVDSLKQFREEFYHSKKPEKQFFFKSVKKNIDKIPRDSLRLKSTRESRGIEMIASLRRKADELEKVENIKKLVPGAKKIVNHEKIESSMIQNSKVKINFQTYLKEYSKGGEAEIL